MRCHLACAGVVDETGRGLPTTGRRNSPITRKKARIIVRKINSTKARPGPRLARSFILFSPLMYFQISTIGPKVDQKQASSIGWQDQRIRIVAPSSESQGSRFSPQRATRPELLPGRLWPCRLLAGSASRHAPVAHATPFAIAA